MVGLSPAWIVISRGEILKTVHQVDCKREENVVVDEDLLFLSFIRVKSRKIAFNNCNCSLCRSFQEVIVDFVDSSVFLCPLSKIISREVFDNLEFFIPISDTSWVEAIQRIHDLWKFMLRTIGLFLLIEISPMVNLETWLVQEVLLSSNNLVDILFKIFAKSRRYLIQATN